MRKAHSVRSHWIGGTIAEVADLLIVKIGNRLVFERHDQSSSFGQGKDLRLASAATAALPPGTVTAVSENGVLAATRQFSSTNIV